MENMENKQKEWHPCHQTFNFRNIFTLKAMPLASSKLHEVASARVPSARAALKAAWTSSWTVGETVQVWPDPGVSSVPCHTLSVVATGMVPRWFNIQRWNSQ